MCLNGSLNYGKSKSASARLSGDEGIEQSVTNLRRDTRPLIGYEHAVRSIGEFRMTARKLMTLKLPALQQHIAVGG